jgi:hypothetical protein
MANLFTSDSVSINGKVMKLSDYYAMVAAKTEQAEHNFAYMGMQEDAPLTAFMLDRSDNES